MICCQGGTGGGHTEGGNKGTHKELNILPGDTTTQQMKGVGKVQTQGRQSTGEGEIKAADPGSQYHCAII